MGFQSSPFASIEIPAPVETIGAGAFHMCKDLTTLTFEAGSKLKSIFTAAFKSNDKLSGVEIPASVETIEKEAFYNCTSLATLTFEVGSKLKAIGERAFQSSPFASIEIPAPVETIG